MKACSSSVEEDVTVAGTPERTAVIVRAHELLEFARRQGFRPDELIEIMQGLREASPIVASAEFGI